MVYTIGIDIGGTKVAVGIARGKSLVSYEKFKTPKSSKELLAKLISTIDRLMKKSSLKKQQIKNIGIGVPGPIVKGKILAFPNAHQIEKTHFLDIEKKFKIPIYLDNDVNCIGIAERLYGAAKKNKHSLVIAVGTGIGGAIIENGKIIRGNGAAGEFGHMIVHSNGLLCQCGKKGCLEQYASGKAIERMEKKEGRPANVFILEEMAKKGDKKSIKIYENAGHYLGIGLHNLSMAFNPDIIIIGGGLGMAETSLFESSKKYLKGKNIIPYPKIVKARLGWKAGMVGAANLYRMMDLQ